jgi:hypothetical protein
MANPGAVLADKARPGWWKRYIVLGITFGISFAIACALIFGVISWYKSRAKPWNTNAITASYGTLEFSMPADGFIVEFGYDFQNNTTRNYDLLPSNIVLMAKLSEGDVLSKDFGHYQKGEATIEGPSFIPPKAKARVTIKVQYYYPSDFTAADKEDVQKVIKIVSRRVNELDGFVVFDNANHFQIVMSKGWDTNAWHK